MILKGDQRERYESCWDFTWTDRKLGESTGGVPRRVVGCNAENDTTMSCGTIKNEMSEKERGGRKRGRLDESAGTFPITTG